MNTCSECSERIKTGDICDRCLAEALEGLEEEFDG